jgi:hypothetical protein
VRERLGQFRTAGGEPHDKRFIFDIFLIRHTESRGGQCVQLADAAEGGRQDPGEGG